MSRFLSKEEYPRYYHPVNVLILLANHDWLVDRAWLAVNDDGRYIWTIDGTDKVLLKDKMKALMVYIIVAGLLYVLAMVTAYAAHYAPANSIIEAFWAFSSISLWMGVLAVVIMAGIVHLSGK